MDENTLMKVCSKCKIEKPYSEFHKSKDSKDGLRPGCKGCSKIYYQTHKDVFSAQRKRYREENKAKISENNKNLYYKNKSKRLSQIKEYKQNHKVETSVSGKRYYQKHKDKLSIQRKEFRENHKTEVAARGKLYQQTQNGKITSRKSNHKYRALKRGATVESFSYVEVFERDSYVCQLCGIKTRPDFKSQYHPKRPELDHIVPLSLGGQHSRANTQCLCRHCNMTKNNVGVGDQLRLFG